MQRPRGSEMRKDTGLEATAWILGQARALLTSLWSSGVPGFLVCKYEQQIGTGKISKNENGKEDSEFWILILLLPVSELLWRQAVLPGALTDRGKKKGGRPFLAGGESSSLCGST